MQVIRAGIAAAMALTLSNATPPATPLLRGPDCAGVGPAEVGSLLGADNDLSRAGPLIGRWRSGEGELELRVTQRAVGDVFVDALGGIWRGKDGSPVPIDAAVFDRSARTVTLRFERNARAPLTLAHRGAEALVVMEPAGGSVFTRQSTAAGIRLEHLAIEHEGGAGARVKDGAVHVSMSAGTRGYAQLISPDRLGPEFDVEVGFQFRASGAGTFVCIGAVNHEPRTWDPFRYAAAGYVQGAREAGFTMQVFYDRDVARFVSSATSAREGRLRLLRNGRRVFVMARVDEGWHQIATQVVDLWERPRLMIVAGKTARAGAHGEIDLVLSNLRVSER